MSENPNPAGPLGRKETENSRRDRPASKGGRNYVPKGVGNGGARAGAGRPPGKKNDLPYGVVGALNAAHLARRRLGPDASPEDLAAMTRVYQRVSDVLEEQVHFTAATSVLKAGAMAADTLAGPMAQKVQHQGTGGGPVEFVLCDIPAKEKP